MRQIERVFLEDFRERNLSISQKKWVTRGAFQGWSSPDLMDTNPTAILYLELTGTYIA